MSEVLLAVLLAGLLADGAGGAALRGEAARGLASTGFDFAGAGFLAAGLAAVGFGAGDLDFFLVAILLECRKGSAACRENGGRQIRTHSLTTNHQPLSIPKKAYAFFVACHEMNCTPAARFAQMAWYSRSRVRFSPLTVTSNFAAPLTMATQP